MEFIMQTALQKAKENQIDDSNIKIGQANIKVFGMGGGGGNAASWLHRKGIKGAEVICCNTDKQHLDILSADKKILIGKDLTRGLGCGGFLEKGTGSAPVIARLAKETGAIVIGTVTMPFDIERARIDKAEFGLQQLRQECDTVIVIDNNRLVQIAGNLPIQQAFAVANELVATMIKGIVETIAL